MLSELHIRNFAIIDDLHLIFGPGLNILTGETGAGKSIIIDALGLLLGDRAATEWVRAGSEVASIAATFQLDLTNELMAEVRQRIEELLHGQMSWGYGLHLFDPLLFAESQRKEIPVGVKLPTVVPGRVPGSG